MLLGLRNPAMVNFVRPNDYTRPEQARKVLDSLEKHQVRYLIWFESLDLPGGSDDHLGPLRLYLHTNYHRVLSLPGRGDIWERNEQANEATQENP